MKPIQSVSIWIGGTIKTANVFQLSIINDNVLNYAQLYYQLGKETPPITSEEQPSTEWLTDGNLSIQGTEYQQWNNDPDTNTWIYVWAAQQLNLTMI